MGMFQLDDRIQLPGLPQFETRPQSSRARLVLSVGRHDDTSMFIGSLLSRRVHEQSPKSSAPTPPWC